MRKIIAALQTSVLFKDVTERHALKLVRAKPLKSGKVSLIYSTQIEDVLSAALAHPRAVGMEITIFNPRLDTDGKECKRSKRELSI